MKSDVIIIGAGAAGLMCAVEASKRGRTVTVLEHLNQIGNKIRISGGGRCNFTNLNVLSEHYLSANPRFCASALAQFSQIDFIRTLEETGIAYYEKEDGQLFCKDGSSKIITMFHAKCTQAGVTFVFKSRVLALQKKKRFVVTTNHGIYESSSLVIATGGVSCPQAGATGLGYDLAKKFGIHLVPTKPGLVPLVFSNEDQTRFYDLSGVSLDASVICNGREFTGKMLFTHKGLSGPVILQASSYWNKGDCLVVNLFPGTAPNDIFSGSRHSRQSIRTFLSRSLPRRFVQKWLDLHTIEQKPLDQYSQRELATIAGQFTSWNIFPAGTAGYKDAEVTVGGVDTDELSSKTMEAKKVPGLFFVGEVIDVTGQLGGYNLQWAWSSGFVAGQNA